jgi:hypothetical protein
VRFKLKTGDDFYIVAASGSRNCEIDVQVVESVLRAQGFTQAPTGEYLHPLCHDIDANTSESYARVASIDSGLKYQYQCK